MCPQLDGVIFDMDGVLCDSEAYICQAAQAMFRDRYGLDVPDDDFLPFVGMGENNYLCGPGRKYGVEVSLPADKVRTYELYLQIIKDRMPPLPGAVEFLRWLVDQGRKIAVASAADRMKVEGNLRQIGFAEDHFHAVVTGSDVTAHKPDPQCFLMAAERMGLDPKRCCVVEDAISGCRAAKAAGAVCLGLTTSFPEAKLREAGADFIAPDLAHVPAELRAMLE